MAGNHQITITSRRGLLIGAPLVLVLPASAAQAFWTARYQARKGDVTLAMYRKRLHAPALAKPRFPCYSSSMDPWYPHCPAST